MYNLKKRKSQWDYVPAAKRFAKYAAPAATSYASYKTKKWLDAHSADSYFQVGQTPNIRVFKYGKNGRKIDVTENDLVKAMEQMQLDRAVPTLVSATRKPRKSFPKRRYYRGRRSFRNMPRRRYNGFGKRRRFYRRRRPIKRRRYQYRRPSLASLVKKIVTSQLTAPMTWLNEGTVGKTAEIGQMQAWIPYTMGSAVDFDAALQDTGEGALPLSGYSTIPDSAKYHLKKLQTNAVIKNVSEHDMYVKVYFCVAREHVEDDSASGAKATALAYLSKGWEDKMLNTDEVAVNLGGTSDSIEIDMLSVTPYMSRTFCTHYKIMKVRKYVLPAGESRSVSMRSFKRFVFDAQMISQSKEDAFRGLTMFPLIFFHGTLGHQTEDTDVVAHMRLTLACSYRKEIMYTWMMAHQPLIAMTNSKLTTGDYEAGTEFTETKDDD